MEVVRSAPETFQRSFRKKSPLPLGQLVEETRKGLDVPHHLLETKIFAKLQGNDVIQAEPSVIHFGGFELGKDYQRALKLINISSEVVNIHIIPTQTKYFQTKYSKKYRLVPGLSYTVKVHFSPDEWRYFYDCIRIHCKGDENILVPVHAYPVINDLDIPPHVRLPPVPLGQSISHCIPLSCSCPIDFEFQVYCIEPHKAFDIQPLSGVIPANGRVMVTVKFTPLEYGTAQTTLQLVISQFNSKPYVCTLTGTCSPYLGLSQKDSDGMGDTQGCVSLKELLDPQSISLLHLSRTKRKLRPAQTQSQGQAHPQGPGKKEKEQQGLKPPIDVTTPAGVAKVLIQRQDKMRSKDLREAMSQTRAGFLSRQMKEALFESKVRQDVQEERANTLRWQVHLGKDPVSAQTRKQVLEERERAIQEYKIKREEVTEAVYDQARTQLSLRRVLRAAGQLPDYVPEFHAFPSSPLEVRQRVLLLFQQAARKVLIRCRMDNRLLSLKLTVRMMKRQPNSDAHTGDDEKLLPLKLSRDNLHPFSFPTFSCLDHLDELTPQALGPVPVKPVPLLITTHVPFFKLKVPQHYRLMGYRQVSPFQAWEGSDPSILARPLRSGAQDELLPAMIPPLAEYGLPESAGAGQTQKSQQDQAVDLAESPALSFSAPPALLRPPNAHPLRIFNPAPGLQAFKKPPRYLECDPEFHLCPLPMYPVPKGTSMGVHAASTQRKFLDRTEIIRGVMTWKKFQSAALSSLSSPPTLTSSWTSRMSDPFNEDLLPSSAPPALTGLPEELKEDVMDGLSQSKGVALTPEMLRAEFPLPESTRLAQLKGETTKDDRQVREPEKDQAQPSKLASKVQARLRDLKALAKTDFFHQ
ncbi:cilia- and flagella-associated protein 221 [Anguilla rostrata]|uniref:cilia- and flagella-associated protein 221 n=1 Tax=Anguilla rostrata TaxID=7938 RepID=UPI0030D58717